MKKFSVRIHERKYTVARLSLARNLELSFRVISIVYRCVSTFGKTFLRSERQSPMQYKQVGCRMKVQFGFVQFMQEVDEIVNVWAKYGYTPNLIMSPIIVDGGSSLTSSAALGYERWAFKNFERSYGKREVSFQITQKTYRPTSFVHVMVTVNGRRFFKTREKAFISNKRLPKREFYEFPRLYNKVSR